MTPFKTALGALALVLLTPFVALAGDSYQIIHAGTLLADARDKVKTEQTILVRNDVITAVRDGYLTAADFDGVEDAAIIDLKDKFVMPGMIDSHTHVTGELGKNNRIEEVTLTEADLGIHGVLFGKRILAAGFTTIRNVGGPRDGIFALRDGIRDGFVEGPRILSAGYTISPLGGHGDTNGYRKGVIEPNSGICNGADDCRRAVRDQVKFGADVIKFVATGGVLSNIAAGTGQQFTDAEQKAIVETAHTMGRKVAAHAHNADGINAALRAGVDSIEHGTYLDKESIRLFKKTGAYHVPTVLAGITAAEMADVPGVLSPAQADKARRVGPAIMDALSRSYKGGVKIAFGTDSGVSKHGINGRELELMVQAGMPERAVLVAATVSAADLLGISDIAGTISVGKSADIIAADANPLDNISTLRKPAFVMARGRVFTGGE
ncbi:metal-dependent hydrolase family protein [Emcibacter nanhaiensis]|uniref:Amidohydrolase family protein n=1 Tax=Emcibacter nanhaiensis TaxID=1505037 RepID=A0A501PBN3_9PROT|nr:amidohydrolase family protein [Emcibacter nanhaiensis]TPD57645.1 amidohydrolase family protein [Emcibacter nanhaiensis]